jgi:hypothetical protein
MTLRFALEVERSLVDYLLERQGMTRADLPPVNMLTGKGGEIDALPLVMRGLQLNNPNQSDSQEDR